MKMRLCRPCALALEAGACIMQHYRNGVEAEEKSDKSPVTQADRDAEEIIERALAALTEYTDDRGRGMFEHGLTSWHHFSR